MHANLRNFLWALSSLNNLRLHISKLIYCKVHALLEHVYLHVKHIFPSHPLMFYLYFL